jgi:hypothetical protein
VKVPLNNASGLVATFAPGFNQCIVSAGNARKHSWGMFMPEDSERRRAILLGVALTLMAGGEALAQSDLRQSKVCSADDGGWSVPGGVPATGEIIMNNDGGWCGQRLGVEYNQTIFGGAMHLSRRPAHGQVSITRHNNGTDVYYRPNPGYTGPDAFSVLVEFYKIDKPYKVIVK